MSNRQDQEREARLQPKRIKHAIEKLHSAGIECMHSDNTKITFEFKGQVVRLFPYSGWHSGTSIKDGRGLENLIKQLT